MLLEDPVALAQALEELVGNADRRRESGPATLDTVTRGYSLDSVIERIVDVLRARTLAMR